MLEIEITRRCRLVAMAVIQAAVAADPIDHIQVCVIVTWTQDLVRMIHPMNVNECHHR